MYFSDVIPRQLQSWFGHGCVPKGPTLLSHDFSHRSFVHEQFKAETVQRISKSNADRF